MYQQYTLVTIPKTNVFGTATRRGFVFTTPLPYRHLTTCDKLKTENINSHGGNIMKRQNCESCMMVWMREGYCLSSNTLAKLTSYTPQHITRTLKKLHKQGKVSYAVIPHQGRSKIARMWCGVGHEDYHSEYKFVKPEYKQLEMSL